MITLKSEIDEQVETVICSGENPQLKEARFALTENKKITQAMIKLIIGDDEWSFILDSTWMNYRSLKTPKVLQDYKDDPDGLFYEKVSLIDKAVSSMEIIFSQFISLRISQEWKTGELPALVKWINGREA